ncbi:MAG TPA: hypothetical protein VG937_21155 [Polyangiaceae bacterium]|nr:hypothetical protein [Polyangiaceae bacterium]
MARHSVWSWALLVGVVACGGPQRQGGSGSTCFRDDECAYGLVCAAQTGGSSRSCTEDVTGLISLVDAGLPSAGAAGSSAGRVGTGGAGGGGGKGGASGSATGGAATGGAATGGAATGGASTTGGTAPTGGTATGGSAGGA